MSSNVSDSTTQAGDADGATPAKRPMTNSDLTTLQKYANSNKKLVRMICQDLHSYDIVNCTGFRNFLIDCMPNYTLPSSQDVLGKLIPKEYIKEKKKMKEILKSVDALAVSIEVWRSINGQAGHATMWSLTIHFIHQEKYVSQNLFTFEQKINIDRGLDFCSCEIAKEIIEALIDWDIQNKFVCFVIQKVHTKKMNLQLVVTKLLKIPHVYCAASALNQVVQDGLHYIYITKEFQNRYQLLKFRRNSEYVFFWHQ
ncbi:hypothetical protein B5X24_HaOG202000 [Helicoverpa armigera]|uniref:Uncharacterized protein n=1 Tax=Helicoverpa armigera TaxID=29058 RepID=A0A2W1C387_HELAM|nr:hypothetical protein B5X24_HaOG202000 [Helicoverpa armigera]